MKNFVQKGDTLTFTATANIAGGAPVLEGKLFGINNHDVKSGEEGELCLFGVFSLAKTEAQAWTFGAALYWDATNSVVTTTAGSNVRIGHAAAAAANPSTTGLVRLSGASH